MQITVRQALSWTIIWILCALIFNVLLWIYLRQTTTAPMANALALQFLTGYLIEKSLSLDNLFVFIMIFKYLAIPEQYQRRVLSYGIACAIGLRLAVILAGIWLVNQFHWVLYLFGLFLLVSGIKMLFFSNEEKNLSKNFLFIWLRKHLRLTDQYQGERFFIKKDSLIYVTPLFLALILIEISDIVFALDSLPAIFAISNNPFIILTSNIFAILGLRAFYFVLVKMDAQFHLLKYGIAVLLSFTGIKMLIDPWIQISILVSLSIIVIILTTTVCLSLLIPQQKDT